MGDYLASLNTVLDREFDIIRPTHGPAITEVRPFVQAYIDHRLVRESQILEALEDQGPIKSATSSRCSIKDVDKRLHPAAAHSVLSHMIHLRETGRVSADGLDGLRQSYALA